MKGAIENIVRVALDEDLARGDLTTDSCVEPTLAGSASFGAREPLVLAGLNVVAEVFAQVDPGLELRSLQSEGTTLRPGDVAATISGSAASILRAERVALNFLQRMSGVATLAKTYVDALPADSKTRIADTRKTTPGLRALERYAVRVGGAHNHRWDLSSAVMIKDNHVAAAGGITAALERARQYAPHTARLEVEVDTEDQLAEAVAAGADIIMLDNFSDERVRLALPTIPDGVIVEASGGITLERVHSLAKLGVDVISVGALTHSARAVDIGLDWKA
jgi:nicotinate-nucleotide pyrophosphorylase (carboxylating)